MLRKRYLIIFVAVMLGIGMASVENYTKDLDAQTKDVTSSNPDYYGKGLVSRKYNDTGLLAHKFSAKSSTNFPSQNLTEFVQPSVLVADEKHSFWQIKAQQGVMKQAEDETVFKQQVQITPADNNANNLVINTEKINFRNKESFVYNQESITVISDSGKISAVGMEMDMKTDKLIFLSKVKAQYNNPQLERPQLNNPQPNKKESN